MHPCLKYMAIALAWLITLGPGLNPAHAQWGEVFIASRDGFLQGDELNVDTMVLPDGTPVVGYIEDGQPPTLSFIESGVPRHVTSPTRNSVARFEADRFGIISYAGSFSNERTFGTDHGSRTAIDTQQWDNFDSLVNFNSVTDLALNQSGVPAVVGRSGFDNSYLINRFDIPQGEWALQAVPSAIDVDRFVEANVLAAYTEDNRLLLATTTTTQFEIAIEQADGTYYYTTGQAIPSNQGASIASHGDEVAFAYRGDVTANIGVLSNSVVTYESLPTEGVIAPGSLAYAPDGTLSFVYADLTTSEIIFAQRTSPGAWATESLGVTTSDNTYLSLAFAADGTPYVGVGFENGVSLFSTAFPDFVLGDMDGSGALTFDDIDPFVQALVDEAGYASTYPGLDPDLIGDFNGDGRLTNGDINGFVAALTGSNEEITLEQLAGIPEPSTLAVLALGMALSCRRRPGRRA